jgi:hypothetical protein
MIRGLWTHAGVLYKVQADKLYSVDSAGLTTELGTLGSLGGVVDFESNLSQLCVNDGSHLYVYTPSTLGFAENTDYPGGSRISFLNQRINFLYRATQKYGWTALGDALTIDSLDFKSAESNPDKLVSQLAFNSELVLFGETSTEIHQPTTSDAIYERSSAAIDYGCAAAHSAQKTSNAAFWLSRDDRGQAMVMSLQGHQARRVSDRAIEEKFEGLTLSNARAFTYSHGGQSFYCLNVPGVETTLVWDETFSQWHERCEYIAGVKSQWRPTCHAFAYGRHYFGAGDDLYNLDPNCHKYGDDVKFRQRIAPVISKPTRGRVFFPNFEIVCEKGTGANLMMRYSDDNGATWSNRRDATVGATGEYKARARWNRLGSAFDRVFDVSMTDDAPFNPVAVSIPL